ncbi:glutamate receptor ionotropic, kainate 2-like [Pectinophora gossypiella]|uniref:glutamate receptor ionotropic, kainate 2-like n=1 Tax=Pectinophora gossypiella TaxID=13191 RepID=UPI00214E0A88|nr:glutamate receptor ionotropic, kainate 2-like [Pectinophora gossypiella]
MSFSGWWAVGLLLAAAAAQDIRITVVEPSPVLAQQLAASVEAALAAEGAEGAAPVAAVEPGEALAVPAQVCGAAGATAVLGGAGAGEDARLAGAAAARAAVPLLLAGAGRAGRGWEALALYPREALVLQAARELALAKGWRRAALLHAGAAGPAARLAPDDEQLQLLARALPPAAHDALLRDLLLVLKKAGFVNFVVCGSEQDALRVLDAAQRVGLLAERHAYILLSLELHTQPLEEYSHGGANITGFMLFDPEAESTKEATAAWRTAYAARLAQAGAAEEAGAGAGELLPGTPLLLAYDAARAVVRALQHLQLPDMPAGDCGEGAGAFHADTLLNYLRSEEAPGVTGLLAWEAEGARRGVALTVVELERGGALRPEGRWSPRAGLTWQRRPQPAPPLPSDTMTNRTFNVLIAMNKPYVMRRESTERLSGNDRYEGFCIELIDRLSKILNFNYTFIEQEDKQYGSYNKATGQWNGMLRRLMDDDNMHFAITDLTITEEREKAVDFTTPFMNLGIGILFRRPKPPEPKLFAFLLPFSSGVWLCLGLAYMGTSLLLYAVGRLCPEEWQNPYPCIEEPPALENQFTLGNALWFNLGAVLLQGSEIAPVAYGTRAVASVWWLFALVITSSYTANLASLLAKKTSDEVITNVRDLAHNSLGIKYGAKAGGSTYTFFEHSQSDLFKEMFSHMQTQKMPQSNDDGIKKVMTESYAFLMESTTIEYEVERNCQVYMVGDLLDSKGYGIAMRKNSTYRQALNLALLRLQERGELREMKHTWWEKMHGGGACKPVENFESSKLGMSNFLGLFLVLVVGCALGVVLSCCDLAWHAWRHPRDAARSFRRNFAHELRFVFMFDQSAKPLQGPLIESKSSSAQSSPRESETAGAEEAAPELEEAADEAAEEAARCGSAGSAPRRRRRSSMHTASVRLARLANAPRD